MPRVGTYMTVMTVLASSLFAAPTPRPSPSPSTPYSILEGHWVELRGVLEADRRFVVSKAELVDPQRYETLVGHTVRQSRQVFGLLGESFSYSKKTDWEGVGPSTLDGARVKVEGYYRGPGRLSAREVSARGPGRERIVGRVDAVARTGAGVELSVMSFRAQLSSALEVEHERELSELERGPVRASSEERDEDDQFGDGFRLSDNLRFAAQLEYRGGHERDFDLDLEDRENRLQHRGSVRARLDWSPSGHVTSVMELRSQLQHRDDGEDGVSMTDDTRLGEAFVRVDDPLGAGFDVQFGRQDFDETREWLYDQNLDAIRVFGAWNAVRLEMSLSRNLSDANQRDLDATNTIVYLSNQNRRRHIAAYWIRRDVFERETPIHVGARMIGEWIPDHRSWLEVSRLGGESLGLPISAWGFDAGTTWTLESAMPVSLTVGYAFGQGDADPTDGVDRTFRQTGLHDNNGKLGGVTSFRYYGELTEPELSNMHIVTLGVGLRLGRRQSLDLVFHRYAQHEARSNFFDFEIDERPNGENTDIGWEVDAILGIRKSQRWDLEAVGAVFQPGLAFRKRDRAFAIKLQFRYRI